METEVQNIVQFKKQCTEIVNKLIEVRKSIPMTQEGMADWLKVDRRKVMALENGELNVLLLLNYAHLLSVDVKLTFEVY
ncbi:MAG: helix-turn-helix transcriptional regulator [Candidatus Pacearchaeota archaeon]